MNKNQCPSTSNMPLTNKAAAYIRVSTSRQEKEGTSIETQLQSISSYAKEHGYLLNSNMIFIETKPASKANNEYIEIDYDSDHINDNLIKREEFHKILILAQQRKFNHLIVYCRDRLTRSLEEFVFIDYHLKKYNVQVHFSKPGEFIGDEKDKYSQFLNTLLMCIAEFEANLLSSRVSFGCKTTIENGYWAGGKPPIGYYSSPNKNGVSYKDRKKKLLKIVPYEQKFIQDIFKLYNHYGFGYRTIAKKMIENYGDTYNWSRSKVESILKNETYTGNIVWNRRGGRRNPGKKEHPIKSEFNSEISIIDTKDWLLAYQLRENKSEQKIDPRYFNTPFILRKKLYCTVCKKEMTCKNYGTNRISVYRCYNTDAHPKVIIEKSELEKQFIDQFTKMLKTQTWNISDIWERYKNKFSKEIESSKKLILDIESKIKDLVDKKKNLNLLLAQNVNADKDLYMALNTHYIKITNQMNSLESQIAEEQYKLNKYFTSDTELEERFNNFIHNISNLDINHRRMLIHLLVDKIFVDKDKNNQLSIDIIFHPMENIIFPSPLNI